jgi:hypothetical protein
VSGVGQGAVVGHAARCLFDPHNRTDGAVGFTSGAVTKLSWQVAGIFKGLIVIRDTRVG